MLLCGYRSCCRYGIDSEGQAVDLADYDLFSGGDGDSGDGVPEFAVDEDFSGRGELGFRDTDFADQALLAGDDFVAAGADGDAHQESGDDSERDAHGEGGGEADAHFGDGAVDQEQAADGEKGDASGGEDAVAGEFGFGGEEGEGSDDHGDGGETHGQQIQGEGGEKDEDHADGAGNDRAGMVEFGVEGKGSDGEQDEGDVRVHEVGEDALFERHLVVAHGLGIVRSEGEGDGCAVEAFEALAVELAEQVLLAGSDVLDQVLVEGFLIGEGFRLADGAFGEFDVASALGDDGAHEGGGVVLEFQFHDVVHLFAEDDGMSGSGVGAGSHGGDVGGFEDEESGGGGAAAAGGDVEDDGHGRGDDFFDDVAGGIDEASRSVDLDEDGLIVVGGGGVEGASDEFGGDGLDGVVDGDAQDVGGAGGGEEKERGQKAGGMVNPELLRAGE